jgi:Uma2 family endonuclease
VSSQTKTLLTPEEYLEIERKAERKSEYYGGQMFAMAGASRRHSIIVTNIAGSLWQQLKGKPCEVHTNDLRVRVTPTGLYTYPDVVVVCGAPKFADDQKDTLLNPTVIIEVLSDSTRDYDRGWKFEQYRALPSLTEYLTVDQAGPHVERYRRQPDGWLLTEYRELHQTVELASIACELKLAEIYEKVDWA